MMKTLFFIIAFILWSLGGFSCSEKFYTADVDCNECMFDKPSHADLQINVTSNYRFNAVPIVIYEGNIEYNNVVLVDTVYSEPYYAYLKVNTKYSIKAEYKVNNKTFQVLNEARLKVMTVSDACEETCYIISKDEIDVTIKKEFLNY